MLQIDNVDVSIGSVSVLRNVSLSVPSGQFAGLIGRNGAGKTTLMRSIMGILPCKKGTITRCPLTRGRAWASATCRKTGA